VSKSQPNRSSAKLSSEVKPDAPSANLSIPQEIKVEAHEIDKQLERQKLELEIRKLKEEVKTNSLGFELFKAIAALATVLGIIFTFYLGLRTQHQAQLSRDDERFDKSLSRLAGSTPAERLTGIASIQQFLRSDAAERRESAMVQLINAAVVEHDPTVRSALLDIFNSLPELKLEKELLHTGLAAARDRNRATLKQLQNKFWNDHMNKPTRPVDPSYDESMIGIPSQEEKESLEASAELIASFVRAGAYASDLSAIYCVGCKFSTPLTPVRLEGTKFDGAILSRAVFSGAKLSGTSFHNASLLGTRFINADLRNAQITFDVPATPPALLRGDMSGNLAGGSIGGNFACSDLSGANFAGTVLFQVVYNNPIWGGSNSEFYGANLEGTNFSETQILVLVPDEVVPAPPNGMDFKMLPTDLAPITWSQGSGPGQPTKYFNKGSYLAWTLRWWDSGTGPKPIPMPYWPDLRAAMISLYAAKNLDKAKLPKELRSWMDQNKTQIEKPISSYNCSDMSYY